MVLPQNLTTEFSLAETGEDEDEDETCEYEEKEQDGEELKWYDRFVVHTSNKWRQRWNGIVFVMLIYIATGFPYRYTFIESKIPDGLKNPLAWQIVELIIDVLFWMDLFLNFLFTFWKNGEEVTSLCAIAKNYLTGFFIWNLVACLPSETFQPIMELFTDSADTGDNSVNKVTRMTRLQRATRLARLTRIGRLAILFKFEGNEFWTHLKGTRGMRIINLGGFLLWIVHLLACGWYLVAALHSDFRNTWVARRVVDFEEKTLVEEDSFSQWAHSMYFVLTVFTTVGFGDMSAFTLGETIYLNFAMLVGMIVNSVIVGEVLNIVNSMDSKQIQVMKTKEVMAGFTAHCHVGKPMVEQLEQWIEQAAFKANLEQQYDRTMMRDLITTGAMPHKIMKMLPQYLFAGRLQNCKLVTNCLSHTHDISPRFILLLALSLSVRVFQPLEVVYQLHDNPFNIFVVDAGVFAYAARPTLSGGVDESAEMFTKRGAQREGVAVMVSLKKKDDAMTPPQKTQHLHPYKLFCPGSYFGDVEVLESTTRQSTARCEGPIGRRDPTLLVLHKPDYYRLLDEFPHCANAWSSRVAMNERRRLQALAKLTVARPYQQLAAHVIQKNYMERKDRKAHDMMAKILKANASSEELSEIPVFHTKGIKGLSDNSVTGVVSKEIVRSMSEKSPLHEPPKGRWRQSARRTVGGANFQLEERHPGSGLPHDPARTEIAKLRKELRVLQRSVDDLHSYFQSGSLGFCMNQPGSSWTLHSAPSGAQIAPI